MARTLVICGFLIDGFLAAPAHSGFPLYDRGALSLCKQILAPQTEGESALGRLKRFLFPWTKASLEANAVLDRIKAIERLGPQNEQSPSMANEYHEAVREVVQSIIEAKSLGEQSELLRAAARLLLENENGNPRFWRERRDSLVARGSERWRAILAEERRARSNDARIALESGRRARSYQTSKIHEAVPGLAVEVDASAADYAEAARNRATAVWGGPITEQEVRKYLDEKGNFRLPGPPLKVVRAAWLISLAGEYFALSGPKASSPLSGAEIALWKAFRSLPNRSQRVGQMPEAFVREQLQTYVKPNGSVDVPRFIDDLIENPLKFHSMIAGETNAGRKGGARVRPNSGTETRIHLRGVSSGGADFQITLDGHWNEGVYTVSLIEGFVNGVPYRFVVEAKEGKRNSDGRRYVAEEGEALNNCMKCHSAPNRRTYFTDGFPYTHVGPVKRQNIRFRFGVK